VEKYVGVTIVIIRGQRIGNRAEAYGTPVAADGDHTRFKDLVRHFDTVGRDVRSDRSPGGEVMNKDVGRAEHVRIIRHKAVALRLEGYDRTVATDDGKETVEISNLTPRGNADIGDLVHDAVPHEDL